MIKKENTGKILSIKGQIVEVLFRENKPKINDLVIFEDNKKNKVKMEVYASSGEDSFYCLVLGTNRGLYRGATVTNTGNQILVPLSDKLLGRAINVFGDPLDALGAV